MPTELTKPTASFTANNQAGEAPLSVAFQNNSTGTIIGYSWSFGDGNVSQSEHPSHRYLYPGDYTVSLTVFNAVGSHTTSTRIDVTAPLKEDVIKRGDTTLDIIRSVYANLRRPSSQKLHYTDILDIINDLLRGYSRDLHVSEQNHRTDEAQCTLNYLSDNDYVLTIPNVEEVEPMALRFLPNDETQQDTRAWREVVIVPIDYFSERHLQDAAVCSFYAGTVIPDGVKVKINLSKETIENAVWQIRYKTPLLQVFKLCAKTPLPADLLPMLKVEATLLCMPRVRDDSEEWLTWRKVNEPIFAAQIGDWRKRWKDFLDTNTEPNYYPKTAANSYRRTTRNAIKPTVVRHTTS